MPHEIPLEEGRGVVSLHFTPGRKRPAVRVVVDGAPIALEAIDLMSGAARERLVQQVPEPLRAQVRTALVTLALEPAPTAAGAGSDTGGEPDAIVRPVELWPDPVVPEHVVEAVHARLERHLHLPPHAAPVLVAWLILTYAIDWLPTAPALWVRSPTRGCGKSTVLDLVTLLAARALKAENATLSALFRLAEQLRPTLVLDEIDQWLVDDRSGRAGEIIGFLNASFARGGRFLRSVGDDHQPKAFNVHGLRCFAGIGRSLHDTTRSRSFIITLERAPAGVRLAPLQVMHAEPWAAPLRQQLARLAAQLREGLEARLADPEATAFPSHLDGRARDLWLPALALGDEIGGVFGALLREACEVLTRRAAREEGDIGVLLLLDIRRYFAAHSAQRVQPSQLLQWLVTQEEAPWSEFKRGNPLSARGLADLLKRFDIASTPPQRHLGQVGRWLDAAMFADAWARYCPAESDATSEEAPSDPLQRYDRNAERNVVTRNDSPGRLSACTQMPELAVQGPAPVDDGYWSSLFGEAA